jgi:hypothetical protein
MGAMITYCEIGIVDAEMRVEPGHFVGNELLWYEALHET